MDVWQINLRHARAMVEIVARGSISAAAAAVSLSQPAITQAMNRLENGVGAHLFDRTATGMVPRPSALQLAPRLAAALGHIGSPRVTATQARAFVALARHGSYAAASQAAALSQPSLHRAVSDLAIVLGRTLVERRGRGVMLTAQGKKLARDFRLAQAELEAGLFDVQAQTGSGRGRIVIGAMPLSRARLLPQAVTAFHRKYPDVDIVIAEGSHAELLEPLRDGDLDLLIGALREQAPGQDVVQTPLFDDRPVVIAKSGHRLGRDAALSMDTLAGYPWIVAPVGTPLRTQWQRMFADAGMAAPHVPIECSSVIMIRQILLETDFLTLLSPDQVAVELNAGLLMSLSETPPGLKRTIGLTTRADWRPTERQADFIATLKAIARSGRDGASGVDNVQV